MTHSTTSGPTESTTVPTTTAGTTETTLPVVLLGAQRQEQQDLQVR